MPAYKIIDIPENENPVVTINNLNTIAEDEIHLIIHEKSGFFSHPAYCELLKREADFLGKTLKVFLPADSNNDLFERVGIFVEKLGATQGTSYSPRQTPEHKKIVDISQPQFTFSEIEAPKADSEFIEEISRPDEIEIDKEQTKEIDQFLQKSKEIKTKPYFEMPKSTPFYSNKLYLIALGALLVLGYLAFTYLPQAKIILISARNDYQFNIAFRVDKNAATYDIEKKIVPGGKVEPINFSKTFEFPITASKNIKEKAKGKVIMFNTQDAAQGLVKSTRLEGLNGKIYTIDSATTIPAKSQIEVAITASNPGADYNMECSSEKPCDFTVFLWKDSAKGKQVYGQSQSNISGGLIGEGKILTDADLKQARDKAEAEWKKEGIKELKNGLTSGAKILDEKAITFNIKEIKSDVPLGGTADKFNLFIRGEISTVAILDADIKEFIDKIIKQALSADRKTYPEKIQITYKEVAVNPKDGIMDVNAEVVAEIGYNFDPIAIKKEISGKSREEIKKYLNEIVKSGKATDGSKVVLWPPYIARSIPNNLNRITVEIK